VRKECQILVSGIFLNVRISGPKQCNEHIDKNDSSKEVPRVVDDEAEWVSKALGRRIEVWGADEGVRWRARSGEGDITLAKLEQDR